MGDRQGRPGTVNLGPFIGVDLTDRLYSRYCADMDVNESNQFLCLKAIKMALVECDSVECLLRAELLPRVIRHIARNNMEHLFCLVGV